MNLSRPFENSPVDSGLYENESTLVHIAYLMNNVFVEWPQVGLLEYRSFDTNRVRLIKGFVSEHAGEFLERLHCCPD